MFIFHLFNFFSIYAHPFEKKVNNFLQTLTLNSSKTATEKKLLALMQENTAILTLWLEKKTKNYQHLTKQYRQQKYINLQVIEKFFHEYKPNNFPQLIIEKFNLNKEDINKLKHLWKIMNFCQLHFIYQLSSSFDKLLVDINKEKMLGDCNQICTLYIHFYALKYPLNDLKIKLFNNHVALYFKGIDIEATTGFFVNSKETGQVLSITEIVSTNILDIADTREKQFTIQASNFFKNAQLAFLLSSLTPIVQHNLDLALQKLAIISAKALNFKEAMFFYHKINNSQIKIATNNIYHQAVQYFVNKNNFSRAKYFAKQIKNKSIDTFIYQQEVIYYLKQKKFTQARKIAKANHNDELIKSVAQNEYANLALKVKDIKNLSAAKKFKTIYQQLLFLAKESKNSELEKWPQSVLIQLESK